MSATTRFTPGANQDNTFRTVTQDYKNPAYASAIALVTNASYSLVNFQQLTGALSLTAGVGNANAFIGDEMELVFAADATSRTVTFSTGFAVTGFDTNCNRKQIRINQIHF